jgi:hypothetical protein
MVQSYSYRASLAVVLVTFALTAIAYGQTMKPGQRQSKSADNSSQAQSNSHPATPVTTTECKGIN